MAEFRAACCALVVALVLGGCAVTQTTAQPGETCAGHRGVERIVNGEDQDGHEVPMLVTCRDGFLVKL